MEEEVHVSLSHAEPSQWPNRVERTRKERKKERKKGNIVPFHTALADTDEVENSEDCSYDLCQQAYGRRLSFAAQLETFDE